ncbi:perilipin-4 [Dryobates pubescens]|uniref:perilipin-4 n=1 Tax=Dryobates pubescens TaxID=118200 RepID=UPI0023BA0813|nr:perilipin-4 [Dryobates pubescens]
MAIRSLEEPPSAYPTLCLPLPIGQASASGLPIGCLRCSPGPRGTYGGEDMLNDGSQAAAEFTMASEKTTRKDLLKAEEQQQASAVNRVTSLPLLNSAFNLVSSAYNHTKETHPCLSGVCNVAETVAAVAVGSMVGGAQPILNQLEPQIALVNEYACKGLDQLEENLPFLQQPADKVISDTKQLVSTRVTSAMDAACEAKAGAKDLVTNKVTEAVDLSKHIVEDSVELTKSAVASTITAAVGAAQGAKDLVTNKVTEAVDLTKEAVQESVEKTKSVVTSTVSTALDAAYGTITSKINTALEQSKGAIQEGMEMTNSVVANSISKAKAVSQAVAGGVETVLGMSEDLVDQYLPVTEEELGQLATTVEGFGVASVEEQRRQQSYFVRLGSLSSRVQQRAYQLSLSKLQHVRLSTQASLSRLQLAINLIESVKQEVGQKLLDGQEKLHKLWVDWSLTQPKGNQVKTASYLEQVESRTLAMLRIITQQLQPVYENLKTSIHGLPSSIQEAVHQATRNIHKLHRSFSSAVSFQDLSSTTLSRSQDCVAEARRSLDDLFEYVTHNTPLNWLVGPFKAKAKVSQECRKQQKKDVMSEVKSATLEEAASSKEVAETPQEPNAAERIVRDACEMLQKLAQKAEKDREKAEKDTQKVEDTEKDAVENREKGEKETKAAEKGTKKDMKAEKGQPEPGARGLAHCWYRAGGRCQGQGWQLTGAAILLPRTPGHRRDLNPGRAPLRPGRAPLRSAPALPGPVASSCAGKLRRGRRTPPRPPQSRPRRCRPAEHHRPQVARALPALPSLASSRGQAQERGAAARGEAEGLREAAGAGLGSSGERAPSWCRAPERQRGLACAVRAA